MARNGTPKSFKLSGSLSQTLCYGENRRQTAAGLYSHPSSSPDPLALGKLHLLKGNDPSYVNMTDLHRLIETATRLGAGLERNFVHPLPHIGIAVKHGNVCGVAIGQSSDEVICGMVSGDPEAISGGVVLVNFQVDRRAALLLLNYLMPEGERRRIFDSIVAPNFAPAAVQELNRTTGKCRMFVNPSLGGQGLGLHSVDASLRFRQVRGGFLLQEGDPFILSLPEEWTHSLNPKERADLILAWAIGSTANSNSIVLVKDGKLLGSGVNQRSRVMACKVALLYADTYGHSTAGALAYSDSFFPFPDGPEVLARAGISTIFATSGSIRDTEVRAACERLGVKLLLLPDSEARGFYGH